MIMQIFGVVRTFLAFGAGYLVSSGLFDQGMADQLVAALMVILTGVWSIIEKRNAPKTSA